MIEEDAVGRVTHGNQALLEPTFGMGASIAALAFQREAVAILAREAFDRRDQIGRDALRD